MRRPKLPELVITIAAGVLLLGAVIGIFHDQGGGAAATGSGSAVALKGFQFGPGGVDGQVGDKVTWTNRDGATHAIRGEETDPAQSKDLKTGDSYSFTFTKAGTYAFVCSIHSSMHGTIV